MTNPASIENVAVLGLGTMGHGIAQVFAAAGCSVRGYDEDAAARQSTQARIRANLDQMIDAELVRVSEVDPLLSRISVHDSEADALDDAHIVIETVREDLQTKQALLKRIEGLIPEDVIITSNTSSYPMSRMAAGMQVPQRALNAHWFNPPHIIPLVEIVPGEKTAADVVNTAVAFFRRAGKLAIALKKELPGFMVNRVQVAMYREMLAMREEGVATTEEIDAAMRGSVGLRLAALGPLQVLDHAGLDTNAEVFRVLAPDLSRITEFPASVQALVDEGHFGSKTGHGLYTYPGGSSEKSIEERNRAYLAVLRTLMDNENIDA